MEDAISDTLGSKKWSGFWSGVIWFIVGYLCIIASYEISYIILATITVARHGPEIGKAKIRELSVDGDLVSIAFLISLPLILTVIFFVVKKRRKQPVFSFLGFTAVTKATITKWLAIAASFLLANIITGKIFDRPPFPDWVISAYNATDIIWLFFIAVIILGPIAEEVLYRGYIIRVWSSSAVGPIFSTLLLSIIWAATHWQYDFYDMTWIFLLGILLCISRIQTRSIYPAIIIHTFWNAASTIDLIFQSTA